MTRGGYIKKEDALRCFTWQNTKKDVWVAIKDLTTFSLPDSAEIKGNTVSRGTLEQIMWERDVAIQQLKDLGYGLGEKPKENNGEWILDYRDGGVEFYHCSKCNLGRAVIDGDYYKSLDEFKKCPICGIDMRKPTKGD